jgi:hypothetical protein
MIILNFRGILDHSKTKAPKTYIIVVHDSSPFIRVYNWSLSGFGTNFSNPASLPTSRMNGLAVHPESTFIVATGFVNPSTFTYELSEFGFGSAISAPTPGFLSGEGRGVDFSPSGNAVAIASDQTTTTSRLRVWAWSSSGYGTQYSGVSVRSNAFSADFSPNGDAIATTHVGGPENLSFSVFAWSSSGFGSKYSDPSTLSPGNGRSARFSSNNNAIVVGTITGFNNGSPFVHAYSWSPSTGIGTKYSNPATLPGSGGVYDSVFSPNDNCLAVAANDSPYVIVYPWSPSTGFGTKYSNPATLPGGAGRGVAFSPDNSQIAVSHAGSPVLTTYPWSPSTGFGTKYSNPSTVPTTNGAAIRFFVK